MSQSSPVITNGAGLAVRGALNNALGAIVSSHKGASEPSYKTAGTIWCDDSSDPLWTYKVYDGADWITTHQVDRTNNKILYNSHQTASELVEFPNSTAGGMVTADAPYQALMVRPKLNATSSQSRAGITLAPQNGTTHGGAMITAMPDGSNPGAKLSFSVTYPGGGTNTRERLFINGGIVGVPTLTTDSSAIASTGDAPYIPFRLTNFDAGGNSRVGLSFSNTSVGGGGNNAAGCAIVAEAANNQGTTLSFYTNPNANFGNLQRSWFFDLNGHLVPGGNARNIGGNNSSERVDNIYVRTGGVQEVSDERAKLDAELIDPVQAVTFVKALEGVTFRVKEKYHLAQTALTSEEFEAQRRAERLACMQAILEGKKPGILLEPHQEEAALRAEIEEYIAGKIEPRYRSFEELTEGKRRHSGFMAQAVKTALEKAGIDPAVTALFVMADPNDSESDHWLRMTQLIAWLTTALQETMREVDSMKATFSAKKGSKA